MNKYPANKLFLFIGICVFASAELSAQNREYALNEFNNNFKEKVTNLYQEKVFIHTDRDLYITGETIWMSYYCLDAALHIPTDISKVLNIELLNNDGQVVNKERIQLDNGLGKGQFFLTADIQSGQYVLRAYTSWMRNFHHDFVFSKRITILNPLLPPAKEGKMESRIDTVVIFFPEGGHLVNGLKSKVAVRITDCFGKGLALTGLVFDNDNNEVAKFSTSSQGYSSFWLTPQPGKTYLARIAHDHLSKSYKLPSADDSGIIMSVLTSGADDRVLILNTTANFQQVLYLIVHTRGIIKKISQINLKAQGNTELVIDKLQPGISHITIMDSDFNPLAERLIFKHPNNRELVQVSLEKSVYAKRQKVTLSLSIEEPFSRGLLANLSVSVFRSQENHTIGDNIISSLLMTSDLKGNIADPWRYFDQKNDNRVEQTDLLMLTHGWSRFDWKNIMDDQDTESKYAAEINAPILTGHVGKNEHGKLPLSLQMNFMGRASVMKSIDIDSDGLFSFEVPFRIRNEKVYFSVNNDTLNSNQITLDSPFGLRYRKTEEAQFMFKLESKNYIERLITNIQISQVYRNLTHINGILPELKEVNSHFYGQPYYLYLLDDYTRFETVKDLFIEYIRSAVIRKKNNKVEFYVRKEGRLLGKSMAMIDGLPIQDPNFILSFDPLKIEKIGTINDIYYVGSTSFQGIINFTTYKGDFGQQEVPDNLVVKVYNGLQQHRKFYSPDYTVQSDILKRIPDFRSTLYWDPDVVLDSSGNINLEFYTSDDTGLYQIEINGITDTGIPIYLYSSFMVKNDVP